MTIPADRAPEAGRSRRFRPGVLLRWLGTFGLGAFVLSRADLSGIARVARGAEPGLVFLTLALYVVDRFAAAYRWQILYVAHGHRLGLLRATAVYLQSGFLGAALPATVGGDIIRARLVAPGGEAFRHAISSVILERLLGTIALVVCAAAGMALWSPKASWGAALPALLVAVGVVAVGSLLILAPPVSGSALERTRGLVQRILRFFIDVHERVRGYSKRPGVLAASSAIALVQQYLLITINWILARALDLPVSLTTMFWIWPFVMLAVRLPISFLGFGVREAVLLGFAAGVGLSPEAAVSLGLLSGLLDLLFLLVGGLLLLLVPNRERSA